MAELCLKYLSIYAMLFTIVQSSSHGASINPQVSTLLALQHTLSGTNNNSDLVLASWNLFHSLCAWRGIVWAYQGLPLNCSRPRSRHSRLLVFSPDLSVVGIHLEAVGLTGTVPTELGSLPDLQRLNLNHNRLTGPVPPELGKLHKLQSLQLSGNELNGSIPSEVWDLCGNLVELVLGLNNFSGTISPSMQFCPHLARLELNDNHLKGQIPDFVAQCRALQELDLSGNSLSGQIPSDFAALKNLSRLDLSHNNLSGRIPNFSKNFGARAFAENSGSLCGYPLPSPCKENSASFEVSSANLGPSQLLRPVNANSRNTGAIAGMVIGSIASVVVVFSLLIRFYDKSNSTDYENSSSSSAPTKKEKEEETEGGSGKLVHFQGGDNLTVDEVLNATGEVLGKSASATVYKARLSDGGIIALRLLRDGSLKSSEKFMSAIHELGRVRHRNLAPVRAFYSGTKGEKLLASDFLSRGNLSELVHSPNRPSPGWARRHKIALGAARGLAYLHTVLHPSVIHGNIKTKNILLDENYEAHLSDFGLHRLMSKSASREMLEASAAQGYKAPELTKLNKANAKTDIYSFGIVLLEILTGRMPGKTGSSDHIVDLPTLVKDAVLEERISELFDLELLRGMSNPADEGLIQVLRLAMGCCAPSPLARPHIKEVVSQLEEIKPKSHSPLYVLSPQYNSDEKSRIEFVM